MLRILLLANYYHGEHAGKIKPYHRLNKTASSWNSALIAELKKLDVELHIVQFYPVMRKYIFKEDNVTYYYLPRVPKIDGYTSLLKRWRVRRLARKIKPDLIHGIGSEHGYAYAAIQAGWPSVITIHGYLKMINCLPGHKSFLKRKFLEREEHKALLGATAVIAINDYMKGLFVHDGCSARRVHVVHNAINPIFMTPCSDTEKMRDIDVLMVGTLHPLKNQHIALEIFSHVNLADGRRLCCVIAGSPTTISGHYYRKLLSIKAEKRLENVVFAGSVDSVELKKLYCKSKLLLHISEFETDSMVLSEAMSCGVIPVVNPVAALRYRVIHGQNGYHIDIHNTAEATRTLKEIIDNYAKAKTITARARQEILSERSPGVLAQETLSIYTRTALEEY